MTSRPFFMIAVDGGGCRGVVPAMLLESLGDAVLGRADLLAGTSTGAILAGGLAAGIPISRIADVYRSQEANRTIFTPHAGAWIPVLGHLLFPRYASEGVRRVVGRFPETAMRLDAVPRRCYFPTFLVNGGRRGLPQWRATAFHNLGPDAGLGGYADHTLLDAILSSTAAPVFFPPHQVGDNLFVDGGVSATNPALSALAAATHAGLLGPRGVPFEQVCVLSLGTGRSDSGYPPTPGQWWLPPFGMAGWMWPSPRGVDTPGLPAVDASSDGVAQLDDYQLRSILGPDNVRRAQLDLGTTPFPMDDYRRLEGPDGLIARTERYLATDHWAEIRAWVQRVVSGG